MKKNANTYYDLITRENKKRIVKMALFGYLLLFIIVSFLGMYFAFALLLILAYFLTTYIRMASISLADFKALLGGEEVYQRVEEDYQNRIFEDKQVIIGKSYILKKAPSTRFRMNRGEFIIALSDICWIYQTITQHRTNGIPTGKSYKFNLLGYNGSFEIIQNDAENFSLIEVLQQQSPTFIFGYSDDRLNLFRTSTSAAEFFAKVAEIENWQIQENTQNPDEQNLSGGTL